MRVLSVSNFYDTHGGGLERVAGHLNREFASAGHVATWAASDADGLPSGVEGLVPLWCANPTERLTGLPMPVPGPKSTISLSRAVRDADFVVIHDSLYATSILAMLFAKLRRRPVVLIQHIANIPFASRVARAIMHMANAVVTRPMMACADELVFISHTVREELLGATPRRASHVIFNGVDQAIFYPGPADRARFGLPIDGQVVVFVGRFVDKKGLIVLRALARQLPEVTFAMVGSGPIAPDQWNLANMRVLGSLTPADVGALFRSVDLLVLPSVGEGYPLVIQEAMACGLMVICGAQSACADPGAAQWLHGVRIDLADPAGTAQRIARLLAENRKDDRQRAAMAEYAATMYSWPGMAKAISAMARSLIQPG